MTLTLPWWCVPLLCIALATVLALWVVAQTTSGRVVMTVLTFLFGIVAAAGFIAGRMTA